MQISYIDVGEISAYCRPRTRSCGEPPIQHSQPQSRASIELHAKAVKLIELSGARDRVLASLPEMMEQGDAAMRKLCPNCDPAFFIEWSKRVTARLNVNDFVDIAALAYESRFTNDELTQLTSFVSSQKTGKPIPLSPALQKKVTDLLPAIMGEITGGCTELGARLGSQVGAEIQKEHPEYFPKSKSPKPQP